ncbi:hypothetical protein [Penaeicola halotolerans]|uniref:hypothetical protein n=1 Tax=Penaeicola halotolerans TaxID=2793196 RepID=UPI001CF807F4|nr:hypothetical protein [Penaeicola halotolerans]
MKILQHRFFRFCHVATGIFLGFTFWSSGMAKLYFEHLFIGWIGPPWLIERLAEFELGLYGQFIALSQVIIGFMLMTQRFRSLGAVMLLPMILNILMVTISQHWVGTPYVLAVLLSMNIFLLLMEFPKFLPLILEGRSFHSTAKPQTWKGHAVWLTGLTVSLLAVGLSYYALTWSYFLVGLGVLIAAISHRADGT